jgi:hypothetical protein
LGFTSHQHSNTLTKKICIMHKDDINNGYNCYDLNWVGHVQHILVERGMSVWLFVWLGFTSHRHSIGDMATFQLYWWRKTSCDFRALFKARTGTLVEPPTFRKLAHERIQSPCRISNPQRWYANALKSTTLYITTRWRSPL